MLFKTHHSPFKILHLLPVLIAAFALIGLFPPSQQASATEDVNEDPNAINNDLTECCDCFELEVSVDSPADVNPDRRYQYDDEDEDDDKCEDDSTSPSSSSSQDDYGKFSFDVEIYPIPGSDYTPEDEARMSVEVEDGNGTILTVNPGQNGSISSFEVNPLESPAPYTAYLLCDNLRTGVSEVVPVPPSIGGIGDPPLLNEGSSGPSGGGQNRPAGGCSGGSCAPVAQLGVNAALLTIPVGISKHGDFKTSLILSLDNVSVNPGSSALKIRGRAGFTITEDAQNRLAGISTDTIFTKIIQNDQLSPQSTDNNAYEIRLSLSDTDFDNQIFRTIRIERIDDKLRVKSHYKNTDDISEYTQIDSDTILLVTGITTAKAEGLCRVTRVLNKLGYQKTSRITEEKWDARVSAGSGNGSFETTYDASFTQIKYLWGWKLSEQIIDPDGAALKTTWSYYMHGEASGPSAGEVGLGKLKSITRPNGSIVDHAYGRNLHITTSPFGENSTLTETRTWDPVTNTLTTLKMVNQDIISKTEHTRLKPTLYKPIPFLQPGDDPATYTINKHRQRRFIDPADQNAYLETMVTFHPVGSAYGGLVSSVMRPDGTLSSYNYSRPQNTDTKVITIYNSAGVGTTTSRALNAFGEVKSHTSWENGHVVSKQESTDFDLLGRPTRTEHFDGLYTTTRTYGCCGLLSTLDSIGTTTEYDYDALKRVVSRTVRTSLGVAPVIEFTAYNGRTTTASRYDGTTSLLLSSVTRSLDGLITETLTPDADGLVNPALPAGSSYPKAELTTTHKSYTGTGTLVTTTHPDGKTTTTKTYLDGRTKSSTDQLGNTTSYSYGSYNGGTWSQITAANTTQWTRSYSDMLGRAVRTEYPASTTSNPQATVFSTTTYHDKDVIPSASVGRVASVTDLDGITTTHAYTAQGDRITTTPVAGNQPLVSTSQTTLADETGPGVVRRTVSSVNGEILSTTVRSVNGLYSSTTTPAGTSTRVRSPQSEFNSVYGTWTIKSTTTDNQYTVQSYENARLVRSESFDNTSASIAWTENTYDSFGRILKTEDSRTGTTTVDSYTDAGAVTSVTTNGDNDTTSYTYDKMGRRLTTTLPNNTVTYTAYTDRGQSEATWGSQTYPRFYTYDNLGRMKTLRTKPTLDGSGIPTNTGGNVTTWNYDSLRGWLTSKRDAQNKGANYTYTSAGRLKTRTWARGNHTRYDYSVGALAAVHYFMDASSDDGTNAGNDSSTPDVAYLYGPLARPHTVTQGSNSWVYQYADTDTDPATIGYGLTKETINYNGFTRILNRHQDSLLRPSGFELKNGGATEHATGYTFDAAGRLSTLATSYPLPATPQFTYGYEANAYGLVKTVTGPAHTVTNTYEANRNVLTVKNNHVNLVNPVSKFTYTVNNIGQRTNLTTSGTAYSTAPVWAWSYNGLGELVEANDTSTANNDRAFQYDGIGNREKTVNGLLANLPATPNYTANALNQYTAIGAATPSYDLDGNATSYPMPNDQSTNAQFIWDAENRLIEVKDGAVTVATYAYDYLGRRIQGSVGVSPALSTHYIYDGWNIIAEYAGTTLSKSYTWGMDLSGSMQGAGGVGGLLAVTAHGSQSTDDFYPTYDGNGNVSEYLDSAGAVQAHYEYDAFGNTIVSTGTKKDDFSHRFSTKPFDAETGLYYYGYRYYDPTTGRWPSRDPIEEYGGINLYGFVGNDGVDWIDVWGFGKYYGKYGGPGWTNGKPDPGSKTPSSKVGPGKGGPEPIDDQDDCYRQHDIDHKECDEEYPVKPECIKGKKVKDVNKKHRRLCKRAADRAVQKCLRKARKGKGPTGKKGSLAHSLGADAAFNFTQRDWNPFDPNN